MSFEPQKTVRHIAIVGGGLTGLAAAWRLKKLDRQVQITVFDASEKLGGVLESESIGDYLIERSADMMSTEPSSAIELIDQLGRSDELLATQPVRQRAYVVGPFATRAGNAELVPVPSGFSLMLPSDVEAVLKSGLLDEEGQQRFLAERDVPANLSDEDESLESFAVRRFGRQLFDRLIQPLISGIYTADPQQLSMRATMARFVEMERVHGSLIGAAEFLQRRGQSSNRSANPNADQTSSGARYDLFRAPRHGMGQLIEWIVAELVGVEFQMGAKVTGLARTERGWLLQLERTPQALNRLGPTTQELHSRFGFDAVILTGSSRSSARLLEPLETALAEDLRRIEAASCAVVALGFERRQFQQEFSGYGIVIPAVLGRRAIAISCASNKFAGRAPEDRLLFRCFIGGALNPELVSLPNEQLLQISLQEIGRVLPFSGQPELTRVYRWMDAMPQYHLGHVGLVERIRHQLARLPGLELAGNSYNGVGIPVCIREGWAAAERVLGPTA